MPQLSIYPLAPKTRKIEDRQCIKEECAWWTIDDDKPEESCCSVKLIALSIYRGD